MKKILYISAYMEYPPKGGPFLRTFNSIKALSQVSKLYLISLRSSSSLGDKTAEDVFTRLSHYFAFSPRSELATASKVAYILRKITRPYQSSLSDAAFIAQVCANNDIDIVWISYGHVSYSLIFELKNLVPHLKLVVDTDSVWSEYLERQIDTNNDPKELKRKIVTQRKQELWLLNHANITTAVSERDRSLYQSISPKNKHKVCLFSNVIDMDLYEKPQKRLINVENYLYIAGTFWNDSPMTFGLNWFIDKVWPIIRRKIPQLNLVVVGRDSHVYFTSQVEQGIHILGTVPSTIPYLQYAQVSIVPLFFESGTRFKILEAGATRTPVVSTQLGAEGLDIKTGRDLLIADSPAKMAADIIKLCQDKALSERLAGNLYSLVKTHYSLQNHMREAEQILKTIEN